MPPTTATLPTLLRTMQEDIRNPACHYWVYTNYFDIVPPTDRAITRWWQTPLFINYDSIWHIEFVNDGILCEVILKNQLPAQRERIKIGYDQIYTIRRFVEGQQLSERESQLFHDSSKLRTPPLPQ